MRLPMLPSPTHPILATPVIATSVIAGIPFSFRMKRASAMAAQIWT